MELKVRYSWKKHVLPFLGCLAFALVSLWVIGNEAASESNKHAMRLAGIFWGGLGCLYLKRILFRRVILVIDGSGFYDRRVLDRALPWSAAAGAKMSGTEGANCFISFNIGDAQAGDYTWSLTKRLRNRIDRRAGDIVVSTFRLDAEPGEIKRAIEHFLGKPISQQG